MFRLLPMVFAIVGFICLCIAGVNCIMVRQFLATARSTQGTVVEMIESRDSDGAPSYVPKVRFEAANGEPHVFTGSVSTSPPAFQVGQNVAVVYNPASPERAQLDVWWVHYFVPLLSTVLGVVFGGLGVGGLFSRRRV